MRSKTFRYVMAACTCLGLSPAFAATAVDNIDVSATVEAGCFIAASPLAFGSYASVQDDVATALSVSCTNTTDYEIALDAGSGLGATVNTRRMTGPGGATLAYVLYSDSERTTVWGETTEIDTVVGEGNGGSQNINVYGRIFGGQLPIPGSYTDTVTATVTY